MTGSVGESVIVDPAELSNLPRLLRNSLAHFNILPINREGRFAGVRIWNRDQNRQITFVADMDFDEMRSLARHVLTVLREQHAELNLRDAEDPMVEVESQRTDRIARSANPPRLNRDLWQHLLTAHHGDATGTKATLDRLMKREAERLLSLAK
jgi:hypothetical protein